MRCLLGPEEAAWRCMCSAPVSGRLSFGFGSREYSIVTSISQALVWESCLSWELCNGVQMLAIRRDFSQWRTEITEQATQLQNTHKLSFGFKGNPFYIHVNFVLSNPKGIVESVWGKRYRIKSFVDHFKVWVSWWRFRMQRRHLVAKRKSASTKAWDFKYHSFSHLTFHEIFVMFNFKHLVSLSKTDG